MYAMQFRFFFFVVFARNCLTSTLDYVVMQLKKLRGKGYSALY